MNDELILSGCRVVTRHEEFAGTVRVRDGIITDVDQGVSLRSPGEDLDGDYLIPGLVELHTDNLETQFQPRPGVLWPSPLAALTAHDTQIVGAGITTVLNGICCGELQEGKMRRTLLGMSLQAMNEARQKRVLRADHLLHLRCEICDPHVLEMFEPCSREQTLRLVSLMDHTPGQRQFEDEGKYREYYESRGWTDEEFRTYRQEMAEAQARYSAPHRRAILDRCRELGVPVASHDDTIAAHVEEAHQEGISITEFPTSLEAAERARELGLKSVMGAPNIVRGGSHSGNISAMVLAEQGLLDCLSSDYVPASLLHGAFVIRDTLSVSLAEALATVTSGPAEMLGLPDRGAVAPGLRADLVQVRVVDGYPVVRRVWRGGRRVL
jgi:alpha-D-ribose 1-methylphosphonate 5-triphosphate diphosphatase